MNLKTRSKQKRPFFTHVLSAQGLTDIYVPFAMGPKRSCMRLESFSEYVDADT
jgi:hypothetical protein